MSLDKQTPMPSEPRIPILIIRDQRVILDADLARLYDVETKALNQAVKRNAERFPEDFRFQLTAEEAAALRSQSVTLNDPAANRSQIVTGLRSQNATLKTGQGQHRKYLPYAFTEFGALMAANVLSSPEAVTMSLYVIRAFVKIREELVANAAILKRLAEIDRTLLVHDHALRDILQKLRPLLAPPPEKPVVAQFASKPAYLNTETRRTQRDTEDKGRAVFFQTSVFLRVLRASVFEHSN